MVRITPIAAAAALALATGAGVRVAHADPIDSDKLSDVAEKTVDSVVNISSTHDVDVDLGPFANDPWFNDPHSPWYVSPEERHQKQKSLGSGVIINAKGRILTNAHVVDGADDIQVTLNDGDTLAAKVVGIDKMSDLAVLQLQGDVPSLQPVTFGDSSKLRLGQVVLAVGDPFGVGKAVTMGIVSAKGRAGLGIEQYEDFIQTDAAINPGNSGGALVDLKGELVGINTAIASQSGGYDGIGFAIPTNMAQPIMDMLVKDGKVTRGYIGVVLAPLDDDYKKDHADAPHRGVVVDKVMDDGPAAHAGLAKGDVITQVDGNDIEDVGHLRNAIAMKGASAKVTLTAMRGKTKKSFEVTTKALPDQPPADLTPDKTVPDKTVPAKTEPARPEKHKKHH